MDFPWKTAAPPLPLRPPLRPSPPPHTARTLGHSRKFPGAPGIVADQLAEIMKNANAATGEIKTKAERVSLAQNKENRGIPLETVVEHLGIKKEEEEGAHEVKTYRRMEIGEAHVDGPKHPLPEKPTRERLTLGAFTQFENQKSEKFGSALGSLGQLDASWNIGTNGSIGLQVPPALPFRTGCTYNTVTHIRSPKYCGDVPCESRPLPALPVAKQPKAIPGNIGYVINSNREYLEEVANRYNRNFGKTGRVFLKIHGIDGLNLPKECAETGTIRCDVKNTDRYAYIVLECNENTVASKRFVAEPGDIRVGEEFAFSVRAGCNLILKLALAPLPASSPATGQSTSSTTPNISSHPGKNQDPEGRASEEIANSVSTRDLSSEAGYSGYSIPRMESSGTSMFSAGGSVAQICLRLDESALARLSIPQSTAGFQQSWPLTRECLVPQEHVKPSSYKQRTASRSLRKQWQKLKKNSLISGSPGVSTLNGMEEHASISQQREICVGNVKASVVVWPYSGDWMPSGFDECVRILSAHGVSNLNQLVKGWKDYGYEWIDRNPNVDLTGILEAASVLGNLLVLGNASVRVAGTLFWKRRFFALHPPHLLALQISDQPPTHVHQAFNLRLCMAIEAPFDTPIQDIQDGLWHPTANAFRVCFRKSAVDFNEEETVELSVDSLEMAKEWVKLLRGIVGKLQETDF